MNPINLNWEAPYSARFIAQLFQGAEVDAVGMAAAGAVCAVHSALLDFAHESFHWQEGPKTSEQNKFPIAGWGILSCLTSWWL